MKCLGSLVQTLPFFHLRQIPVTASKKSHNKAIQHTVQEAMELLHNYGAETHSEFGGGNSLTGGWHLGWRNTRELTCRPSTTGSQSGRATASGSVSDSWLSAATGSGASPSGQPRWGGLGVRLAGCEGCTQSCWARPVPMEGQPAPLQPGALSWPVYNKNIQCAFK